MRVILRRLEELVDAPYFAEKRARVLQRLDVADLTDGAVHAAMREMQAEFMGLCGEYFHLAIAKAYQGRPVEPAHVTSHLPGRTADAFLPFFLQKVTEESMKVNRDHIGDILFRAAMVHYRHSGTEPASEHRRRMREVLYGERDEGAYRRLAARRGIRNVQTLFTDYEDETKRRFWSVTMRPHDIEEFFDHLINCHPKLVARKRIAPGDYVRELGVLADAMRLTRLYDRPRYKACFSVFKMKFTRFVLHDTLGTEYAASLIRSRAVCGMRLRSIASRAGERETRLRQILGEIRATAEDAQQG